MKLKQEDKILWKQKQENKTQPNFNLMPYRPKIEEQHGNNGRVAKKGINSTEVLDTQFVRLLKEIKRKVQLCPSFILIREILKWKVLQICYV